MDYVSSGYRITFDPAGTPYVVLGFGERIDAEPVWGMTKAVEVIEPVDAVTAFLRDGKTATASLNLKVYRDEELDFTARLGGFAIMNGVAQLSVKPLKVEFLNAPTSNYWLFSAASLKAVKNYKVVHPTKNRWCLEWEIVATGLGYV